ncbi:MAG: outer membrane beta-barrel family protein [Bacteroidota bacterium]|nr:outer membrane beta-barrel family protein [Bacteroidota bacterium]MDP4195068.1 outer membrane beta-barrel family protein [Bacteroidota bacterium]
MRFCSNLIVFMLIICSISTYGQSGRQKGRIGASGGGSLRISGKVIDAQTGKPVDYATVVVFKEENKTQVTGSITKTDGSFEVPELKADKYYLEVSFIGYEKQTIPFELMSSTANLDLGVIKLDQKAVSLKNVVVEGQRVPFTYQVDKKVINVDKFATAVSGTAVDVLENVPSISVDVDGNVSLRGSGSFKVLVDGRPSIIDAQDLLQQVPASAIENIEIITNPSVKYDPEGVAGIINLVMKKNENNGLSGVINLNGGLKDKYGSDLSFEYKTPLYSASFGMDLRHRNMTDDRDEIRRYDYENNTSEITSSGSGSWMRGGGGIRGAINFNLGDNDVLGIGANYHNRNMKRTSSSNYTELQSLSQLQPTYYMNTSEGKRNGDNVNFDLNFQHKFPLKGHEISADVTYEKQNGDDENISEMLSNKIISSGKKTTEGGPGHELHTKIDYTLPFGDFDKFEAGLEGKSEFEDESTKYYEYNIPSSQYMQNFDYSFSTKSRNDGYSVYSVYSGIFEELGYQVGLRGEYTYRKVEIPSKDAIFNIDRWDYFPTFHFSYKLSSGQQFMASYSKRIQRPNGWQLEPFDTWVDANTVHRGNPGLEPELVDSYEFGFQTLLGNLVSLSTELYHRVNNSKIDGVKSVYSDNVTLQTFANIGKDYSTGAEIMASVELFKLWDIDLMGNLYNYLLKTDVNGESTTKESFNWHGKMSNSLKLTSTLSLQLNADYNSPTVAYQSKTDDSFSLDMAVKKEFMNKQLSLTLQAKNILNTARWQTTTQNESLYSYMSAKREAPVLMLNLRYSLNNFKQDSNRNSNGGDDNNESYE